MGAVADGSATSKKTTMTASCSAVVFLLLILLYGASAVEENRRGLRGELLRPTRTKTTKKLDCLNDHCLPTTVHDVQARGERRAKQNEGSITYDIFEHNGGDSVKTEATVDRNKKTMKARFKPRSKTEAAKVNPVPATSPSPPVSVSKTAPPPSPVDESVGSQNDSPSSRLQILSPGSGEEKEVFASPWQPKTTDHFPAPTPEAAEPEEKLDNPPKPMDDGVGHTIDIADGDENGVMISGQKGGIRAESDNVVTATQSEEPKENNSSRKITGFFGATIVVCFVAMLICFGGTRLRAQLRIQRSKKDKALHERGSITSEDGKSSLDSSFQEECPHVSAQTWTELHFEDFLSSPEDHRASSPLRMLGRSRTSPACMVMRIEVEEERSLHSDRSSERRRVTVINPMPTFDEYLEELCCEEAKMPMPPVSPSAERSTKQAPVERIQFKSFSHLELGSMSSMYSSMDSESEAENEYVDGSNEENHKADEKRQHPQQHNGPLHPQASPSSSPPKRQTQSPSHSSLHGVLPYPNKTSPAVYPNLPAPLSPPPNEPPSMEAHVSVLAQPAFSTPLVPAHKAFLEALGKYSSDSMDEDENDLISDIQQTTTVADNDVNNNNENNNSNEDNEDDDEPLFSKSTAPTTVLDGIDARFLQRIGMNIGNNNEESSSSVLQGDSSSSP